VTERASANAGLLAAMFLVGLAGCGTATPTAPDAGCRLAAEPTTIDEHQTAVVIARGAWVAGEAVTLTQARDDGVTQTSDPGSPPFTVDDHQGFSFGWPGDPETAGHSLTLTATSPSCSASTTIRILAGSVGPTTQAGETARPIGCEEARPSRDRADDTPGYQIHVVYAIPHDDADRRLDLDGTIAKSIGMSTVWLRDRLDGRAFRIDTCRGAPDISFVVLPRSDVEYAAMRWALLYGVEWDLRGLGFDDPKKIYLVVWGGRPHWGFGGDGCGGEAQVPTGPTGVTRVALNFERDYGDQPCPFPLASGPTPGVQDLGMVHEVIHTLGFVAACAPHSDGGHHVTDSAADLMYVAPPGVKTEVPTELDAAHDDYYGHAIAGCPDLGRSAFLDPLPDGALPPPGWP